MRENTRCEVDEPISTPTDSTHSSSSSPNVRPVDEKKMRPPWASSSVIRPSWRHSGAPRSGEPGIHIPGAGFMDSGLLAPLGPGMTLLIPSAAAHDNRAHNIRAAYDFPRPPAACARHIPAGGMDLPCNRE